MKKPVVLVAGLLAGATAYSGAAAAADFSSWWRIQAQYNNGSNATPICFFQQAGSLLAGTCKGPNAIGAVEGQVNGNQIEFQIHLRAYTQNGATGIGHFYGRMGADGNMTGTSTNAVGVPGQFVAMRH